MFYTCIGCDSGVYLVGHQNEGVGWCSNPGNRLWTVFINDVDGSRHGHVCVSVAWIVDQDDPTVGEAEPRVVVVPVPADFELAQEGAV